MTSSCSRRRSDELTGDRDGEPQKVGVALVDVLTSKDAVIGVLAAIQARSRSGRGQRIEVNLLSSLLGSANQGSGYLATGTPPERMGNQHPSIAPYETLRCQDGFLAVCCGNDAQFRRFARRRVGSSSPQRHDRRLCRAMTEVSVPAGEIGTIGSAIELATSLGLDPIVRCGDGSTPQLRHPITYSATPVTHYLPPPRLGADNDEIRRWLSQETNS